MDHSLECGIFYRIADASWKSILSYIIEIVEVGVAKSLKKGQVPDATMSRVVRQIVNKATSKRRTCALIDDILCRQ